MKKLIRLFKAFCSDCGENFAGQVPRIKEIYGNPTRVVLIVLYIMAFFIAIGLLTGCAATPQRTVAPITNTFIPQLTPIAKPVQPRITGFELDVPRDMSKRVPKNTSACLQVAEAARNATYWRDCGTFAPDPDSNLVAGFDEQNLEKFNQTMAELNAYIQQLNDRIDAANREREFWTAKALEEEKRGLERRREQLARMAQ